jgi:alkylhydroperoxidase family enzyme
MTDDAFELPTDDELDPDARTLLHRLPRLNVIRAAAGAPTVFPAFIEIATALLARIELPAEDREIAVLSLAHNAGSDYVWHQHDRSAVCSRQQRATAREQSDALVRGAIEGSPAHGGHRRPWERTGRAPRLDRTPEIALRVRPERAQDEVVRHVQPDQ